MESAVGMRWICREALKQAIAKRDAGAIAKAVKSVNDSKAAKEKAAAEAKAKAEQEAAEHRNQRSGDQYGYSKTIRYRACIKSSKRNRKSRYS